MITTTNKYTYAVVRSVSDSFPHGLTTFNSGVPDLEKARTQHKKYCKALEENGIELIRLPELEYFPDSVFVEDTAIKVDDVFVIGRAGVASRLGENRDVIRVLGEGFDLEFIKFPGTIEGGDILRVLDHYFIGLSSRTNYDGIVQFTNILDKKGFTYSIIPVRDVLHLKTGVSVVNFKELCGKNFNIIFCIEEFYKWFKNDYHVYNVGEEESYAANILKLNENEVIIPKGYPRILSKVKSVAKVTELDMSEFLKMDGSLTCLSILF